LRAENELKKANIEAEQAVETAKGEAEALKVRGEALQANPGVAQLEAIKKWDGKAPQTVVLQGQDTADLSVVFPIR
jgi:prohibitin 2